MTPRRVEQLLWMTTSALVIAGTLGEIVRQQPLIAAAVTLPTSEPPKAMVSAKSEDDQLRAIFAGDLFRRERTAPDAVVSAPAPATTRPPAPPKPRLVLRGLVGGPPWNAILEGVPGHDGSYVVSTGDSVAGLKIRSVRRDGATIRGMDTTWILKLGRAP
jgi:hypothetical protein